MRVRWTFRAREDLKEIGAYIAQDNPLAARRWVARLKERTRILTRMPRAGRVVPERQRDDIRELIEGNYRIVYQVTERSIDILMVFEGHRLFPR
jgi:addiction module RelE/StbE family toxin